MLDTFVALDLETTGTNPAQDKIIEIGMARYEAGNKVEEYSTFVNPGFHINERITSLTGITDADVLDAPYIEDIISQVLDFIGDNILLGHNIIFDYSFIKKAAVNAKLTFEKSGIDTLKIARRILPELPDRKLTSLCAHFDIDPGKSHRALDDALSAASVYWKMYELRSDDSGFDKAIVLNYSVKKDSPITAAQIKYLSSIVRYHRIELEKPIESLTKSQASRYIDTILSEKGKIPYGY